MAVLVVGASGSVGGEVLRGLLDRGVQVRASVRNAAAAHFPAAVEVVQADLSNPSSFRSALDGIERVFLYAHLEDPEPMVRLLVETGVAHVVLLSSSSTTHPAAEEDFNGARFLKVERAIEASGLTFTFLRADAFDSNASGWSDTIRANGTVALPYPDAVTVSIHEKDIADVAVQALTTHDLDGAKPVLTGPERVTLRQQVAAIGEVLGRPLQVVEQTETEARDFFGRFMPARFVDVLMSGWRTAVQTPPDVSPAYQAITGKPGRSFDEWASEHTNLFK